jgi:hypothetical protein
MGGVVIVVRIQAVDGHRYIFSTFVSGRIMADRLQKEIGSTVSGFIC